MFYDLRPRAPGRNIRPPDVVEGCFVQITSQELRCRLKAGSLILVYKVYFLLGVLAISGSFYAVHACDLRFILHVQHAPFCQNLIYTYNQESMSRPKGGKAASKYAYLGILCDANEC